MASRRRRSRARVSPHGRPLCSPRPPLGKQTDALVARLREIALAYKAEGTREQRLADIETLLAADADNIIALCDPMGLSLTTTTYPSCRASTAVDVVLFFSSWRI
jgi:hypothetical protein